MRRLVLILLVVGTCAATAAAQTTRNVNYTQLWPELQGELALKNGDYMLVALRGQRVLTSENYYSNRILGFDARQATVAYEHFWNARWSWGGTLRLNGYGGSEQLLVPELLVRHRSPVLGGITFGQRLSVERTLFINNHYLGSSTPSGQFWGRLRVDLEKVLPLSSDAAGLALRPRLSYEASTHLRLQKADTDTDERTIQFTSLRGEVGVRLSPHIDFTPWFAYQTEYLETLPQYDSNGRKLYGGKVNDVYPTFGLDLRFTLLPTGTKAGRQQLPTQH